VATFFRQHPSTITEPEAVPERKLTGQQKVSAFYLATVWLTSQFTLPFGDFERIPFYVALTAVMYFFLPLSAIFHFFALLFILGAYEALKSLQADFFFTTKGMMGLVAFSCVMAATFGAMKQLRDCSVRQLGNWLRLVLIVMAAAVALEIGSMLADLGYPVYQNYLLPIPAFSGLFTEPSHFGLALSPFVFMLLIDFNAFRQHVGTAFVGVIAVLAVLCPSATLIAVFSLAACFSLSASAWRMKIGGIAVVVVLGIALGLAVMFVPEISSRVGGVLSANAYDPFGEQNLSALLFEKGKQMAEYALANFPLGVAFLNMVILAPYAPVSHLADVVFYLNSQDGSSILFKGICELGILFIVFAAAAFMRFFRAATRANKFPELVMLSFQFALFVCSFHSRRLILPGMPGHRPVRLHIRAA
jgi:hypothetical protein